MNDNRVHERFAAEVDATVHFGDSVIAARTRNVSSGGMCFEVDHAIELGEQVRLTLVLVFDESPLEPIELLASVVWCTAVGKERFQIGASFSDLTNDSRAYLGMFLRFLREQQEREAGLQPLASDEEMFS